METNSGSVKSIVRHVVVTVLIATAIWSLLVLRFGYRFGSGDQVELLPYTLYLHNPSLFPSDFFIQNLHRSVPNERTVMATLLLPMANNLEWSSLALQFLSTILLLSGLYKVASLFIANRYLAWLSVAFTLIPLNDYALGNVELYSECLQASGVACGILAWALWLFINSRYLWAGILISLSTFIQLLDGLDFMLLSTAALAFHVVRGKKSFANLLTFVIFFVSTAFVYLVVILLRKSGTVTTLPDHDLFRILFEFRHPHHFIFSSFPKIKVAVFTLLSVAGIWFYRERNSVIFSMMVVGLIGISLYAIAVDYFHIIAIGNFQFYKVSAWLKFLGVVALFAMMAERLPKMDKLVFSFGAEVVLSILVIVTSFTLVTEFRHVIPYKVPYEIFTLKNDYDNIDICRKIKAHLPPEALLIQPFDFTELKFHGQRSSYVEFKANVRHKDAVQEWYRRIGVVYGISAEDREKGFRLNEKADVFYNAITPERINQLKAEGVTHMIVANDKPDGKKPMLSNSTYAVYQL